MTRKSSRLSENDTCSGEVEEQGDRLPANPRERNRAVAEREASRLARPERRVVPTLRHASRLKSAVTSTPFGHHISKSNSASAASNESEHDIEEWCGPFSVARQMIAKREEARQKREKEQEAEGEVHHPLDEMMEQVEMERKRKAHPSLQWRGQVPAATVSVPDENQSYYVKRKRRVQSQTKQGVPSLFQMCVDFLCENFEHVEALGDVGSSIRRSICESLVAKNKLNGAAFDAIAETGIEALEVVDCVEVTQNQLAEHLQTLIPAGLRFLMLHNAGRCFGPKAVQAFLSSKECSLFAISITGAYLLRDSDTANLLSQISPSLSSIKFKACPFLGIDFCSSLSDNFSSKAKGCLLELSLEDLALTKESLLAIGARSDALRNLKSLSLRRIEAVDDEVVSLLMGAIRDTLESIDLSYNHNLSDETLSTIRRCNQSGSLRSLELAELKNLTAAGLEALFTYGIPDLPSPPMLRKLNLSRCGDHDAVTDTLLDLVTKASSTKRHNRVAEAAMLGSLSSLGGIVLLNISGSSCTNNSMESLARTCASSIKELDCSFCPHITDTGLGYLVSTVSHQFAKVHIWGCAQLTDHFLDGHNRVGDHAFEIVGAWMKKSGGRSLR